MVKKTGKPGNSTRAKALVSMAQQASQKYLEEIDVNMGDGYSLVYEKPTEESINYAFALTKQNMQELYEQAPEWGWHDDEKMKEIKSAKQHTLFVHHEGQRRGICCLRWLTENNEPVLYLYEIQLEASACRFGLGTKIMTLVEKLASKSRMQKVVLTVLINNVAAVEFYRKLNYTNNEKLDKTFSYRILSKKIKPDGDVELKYQA